MLRNIGVAMLCLLTTVSSGCKLTEPRTQVMLFVHADAKLRALASELKVDIEGRDGMGLLTGPPSSFDFRPKEPSSTGWPFNVALVPRTRDPQRTYRITATAFDGADLIAVVRAHGSFVSRKTVALRLYLTEDCLGAASIECTYQETCQAGSCVSADVDATTLPEYIVGSGELSLDADGGIMPIGTDGLPATMSDAGIETVGRADASADAGGLDADAGVLAEPGNCGDGKLTRGELCDTAIVQGEGVCPSACETQGCLSMMLEGTGCQTQCVPYEITTIASGDGCCPAGADSTSDSDCAAQCGNGKVESGERCEAGDPLHPCPTADSCRAETCLVASLSGDPSLCTAECATQVIEQCQAGDGCCPAACTHDLDSDCSVSCGDGVVDTTAGETCDTSSADTPCPTECDDGDACTHDFLTGSAPTCSVRCSFVPITTPVSGDGCCPPGANASNDLDCTPICGNDVVERGELCDGNCPSRDECDDGRACTTDELTGSGCNVSCIHHPVRSPRDGDGCCPSGANANNDSDCRPVCGNGVRESGETCDGDCPLCPPSTDPCISNRSVNMPDACHPRCVPAQHGPSGSTEDRCCPPGSSASEDADCEAVCGNGKVEPGETCDGACPSCAPRSDPCETVMRVPDPDACHPTCMVLRKGASGTTMDHCCPFALAEYQDIDCPPRCGNGVVESGEQCDNTNSACQMCKLILAPTMPTTPTMPAPTPTPTTP